MTIHATDAGPDVEGQLRFARVDAALRWTAIVILANLATSGLLTIYFGGIEGARAATVWFGAIALLAVVRIWLHRRYQRDGERAHHVVYWERVLLVGSFVSGLIWGVGAIILLPTDPASQWLWSLTVAGMCSGAVALHSAHAPSAMCYIVPACVPLMGRVNLGGGPYGGLSTGLILTFIVLMMLNARKLSAEFGRIFSLQLAMERKSNELDEVNRRLNREIAENERTAAELDQSRKMEAVGRLTAGVAHDFNNLLTVILANLELIARRSERDDVRRFAATAIDAVESGAQLTASMVAFSRKQVLKPQPVDLNTLVGRTMALLTRSVDSSVSITFARKAGVFPTRVDAAQLQTALLNLTFNARDAIAGQGEIRLSIDERAVAETTRLRTGSQLLRGRYVVISVADDGPGIAPEILDKVFEPFFTTKAVGQGTGLGLAQVFGFVTQSGGAVDVASRVGAGTEFLLYLPYFDGPLPETAPTPALVSSASPLRHTVLMVDDSELVLKALTDAVAAEGWDVLTAPDGEAALRVLERHADVDVLVTDMDMPGRTGRDLIDAVRRARPELSIISMSGIPQEAMPAGIPFLAKPFAPGLLVDLIRTKLAA